MKLNEMNEELSGMVGSLCEAKAVGKAQKGIMDYLNKNPWGDKEVNLNSIRVPVDYGRLQSAAEALAKKKMIKLRIVNREGWLLSLPE